MFHVLLYYKIVKIKHPEAIVKRHREVCKALQLKGRILISEYGINGTVAGTKEQIAMYRSYMDSHRKFNDIDWKESTSEFMPFPKMSIKARKEIITTGDIENFNIWSRGQHISRDTLHKWFENGEEIVLLDMRNDYEWDIGRFVGSVKPPMKYFRELKDNMDYYDQFKGKKIVMFCTGGIRCEPASAMFIAAGFDRSNLYQLEGGIVKYAEKYGNDGFYEGKCFVFDDRMAVGINDSTSALTIGNCRHCEVESDVHRNCANKFCNRLFLACDGCNEALYNACSSECVEATANPVNVRPPRLGQKVLHRNK
ncbi:rhodanese-related sulfurtransferase [Candidatus Nomurabacteria bacterium]|nr:rhodanese-related sulfurtransferase [Candidatus Nomurabacteria bacterium]